MSDAVRPGYRVAAATAGVIALVVLGIAERDAKPDPAGAVVRVARPMMGTMLEVSVWATAGDQPRAADAAHDALDLAAAIEARISEWQPTSETSAVNAAAGNGMVTVGPDLRELVARSIEWARRSDGAFDIAGGPLFDLWEHARRARVLPAAAEIEARRALVGFGHVRQDGPRIGLARAGMRLGFGAIGKGFVADRMARRLRESGFPSFVIDAGGDLVVGGSRGSVPWILGVRHPRRDTLLATLATTGDCAVATSGDYERFFVVDGVRYQHILDPSSGWPVRDVVSVTAVASNGTDADALATAVSVLGWERGLALAESVSGTAVLVVDRQGQVRLSRGLRLEGDRLEWLD